MHLKTPGEKLSTVYLFAFAMIIGFACVVLPGLLLADRVYDSPLYPRLYTAVHFTPLWAAYLLFFSGIFLGMVEPRRPIILGLGTITLFPILAVLEKMVDITSHRYFALEFVYYLLWGVAAVEGTYLGRELRRSL